MMFRLKLLTFDVKDTLLKLKVSVSQQYAEAALAQNVSITELAIRQVYGKTWEEKNRLHPIYGIQHGLTTKEWWRGFVQQVFVNAGYGGKPGPVDQVFEQLWSSFHESKNWEVFPNVHEILSFCQSSHIKLGIISNFDDRLKKTLQVHSLDRYFDFILTSASEKVEKPNPEIFSRALKLVSTSANMAGHIGDDIEGDYLAPRKCGMTSFLFDPSGKYSANRPSSVDGRYVVKDFLELRHLI